MGPGTGTPRWNEQVQAMTTVFSFAESKEEMEQLALLYIFDRDYSRGAITTAMHDVEIKKGWRGQ